MAATRGRIEGRITIAAGTTATVGGGTATITAGAYYPSDLLAEVATQFAAASATTCTVTGSLGETGTGLVTVVFGSAKAIAWVSTDLRDLLGFASDSASATTHVGTKQMRGVWLPDCPYQSPNEVSAAWKGHREGDARSVGNHAGYSWTHMGQEKVVNELWWHRVARSRVWIGNEATANASWERFARDCIWGVPAWGNAGGPLRFFPDAGGAVRATYRVVDAAAIKPEAFFPDWAGGPWTVRLPRLVNVPGDSVPTVPPEFVAAGAVQAGTGDLTVPFPVDLAVGDIALLLIENPNGSFALGTPAGFAAVTSPAPYAPASGVSFATTLGVYWCRLTSIAPTQPVVSSAFSHNIAQILTFRGCAATGNPWDTFASDNSVALSGGGTIPIPGATTTVDNCLVVAITSGHVDVTSSARLSSWTNASLTGLVELTDEFTSTGNGGGFGAAAGTMDTAGTYATTTVQPLSTTHSARMSIALRP